MNVCLREVGFGDLPTLFEYQLEPEANQMAAVKPRSKEGFDAHWKIAIEDNNVIAKAILVDDLFAGYICCFKSEELDCVGYWIGKEFWGLGITTQALELLLALVTSRPLHARVAVTNKASIRVLQKCGFSIVSYQTSPANDRYEECEEAILKLT